MIVDDIDKILNVFNKFVNIGMSDDFVKKREYVKLQLFFKCKREGY